MLHPFYNISFNLILGWVTWLRLSRLHIMLLQKIFYMLLQKIFYMLLQKIFYIITVWFGIKRECHLNDQILVETYARLL